MTTQIFIDGAVGTTGLEIRERLSARAGFSFITLSDDKRKDTAARRDALNAADVVILCLPDAAAKEAVALIENPAVRVIDASTAHRVNPAWTYGFPELEAGRMAEIAASKRVANPGCYATGALSLIRPLTRAGLMGEDQPVTINAVSGYSGGGKKMIAMFEDRAAADYSEEVFRTYALSLEHKHVPEIQMHGHLSHPPLVAPSVGRFYRGMMVELPLQLWSLPKKPAVADVRAVFAESYAGQPLVQVAGEAECADMKTLDAEMMKNTNQLKIFIFGNEARGQVRLVALLDNLGKGASGAAVQNLNILAGLPPTEGLL